MGRTDAVAFTLELVREWRALGAVVEFEPGWETSGNGTKADYEGGSVHHTAAASSATRPFPSRTVLLEGRADLPPPLANVAGPWCPVERPLLRVLAAHPANHAGASGGRSMGPLPVTRLFNPRVFGLEIDYAGDVPMAPGQYRAAVIFGAGLTRVLRRPSPEWVRGHAETSVTGKWDPGYAPGRTIDLAAYRRDVWALATTSEEDDMPSADDVWKAPIGDFYTPDSTDTMPAFAALAWSAAHGARARDAAAAAQTAAAGAQTEAAAARAAAAAATAAAARVEGKVDQLIQMLAAGPAPAPEIPAAVAAAVAEALEGARVTFHKP